MKTAYATPVAKTSKTAVAKKRQAARSLYAPKPKLTLVPRLTQPVDPRVRKIVARMLDELKRPNVIPSDVLTQGLLDARAL